MKIVELMMERCSSNSTEGLAEEIEDLIRNGCDVNEPNDDHIAPLHLAVVGSLYDVAQKLLDNNANVDMVDDVYDLPPLGIAIKFKNLEMVCMLLAYGADASFLIWKHMTPLMYAIQINTLDIAKVLLDYYDDFSYSNKYGIDALILAISIKSPFAVDLVMAGADVNCSNKQGDYTSLTMSLMHDNAELFYLIWPKFNCQTLLDSYMPFLKIYLNDCRFPDDQWLECLYLILTSPFALEFVEHLCNAEDNLTFTKISFMSLLLVFMHENEIESNDRLKLIYTILSLGYKARFWDFVEAYQYFGFGEEIMALLYIGDFSHQIDVKDHLLPAQILQLYEADKMDILYVLREQFLIEFYTNIPNVLKFFSISAQIKNELFQDETFAYSDETFEACRLIKLSQEVPSLTELCRSKIRKMILNNKLRYPYQFHDIVNNLKLPQLLKDTLIFKQPIYKI